jgi:hypothetical protein
VQNNAKHIDLFAWDGVGENTLENLISDAQLWFDEGSCDPDTKVTGFVLFTGE